jgi:hypothetical protein
MSYFTAKYTILYNIILGLGKTTKGQDRLPAMQKGFHGPWTIISKRLWLTICTDFFGSGNANMKKM